jgi:hypothetical protein
MFGNGGEQLAPRGTHARPFCARAESRCDVGLRASARPRATRARLALVVGMPTIFE